MRKIVAFDIDGTLADAEWRLGFNQSKPKNWDAFYEASKNDQVHRKIADMLNEHHKDGSLIIFITARSKRNYKITREWLENQGLFKHDSFIIMRHDNDYRPAVEVKEDAYLHLLSIGQRVDEYYEDQPEIVEMFRLHGVTTHHCEHGEIIPHVCEETVMANTVALYETMKAAHG